MINPTGSTGYGQEFVDAINCNVCQDGLIYYSIQLTLVSPQWGGSPFKDLVAGLQFVKSAYSDLIDPERMAMAGGSYGYVS
jgi:dipeptidyl aminopeptidase/acylaminoacyl peptidase